MTIWWCVIPSTGSVPSLKTRDGAESGNVTLIYTYLRYNSIRVLIILSLCSPPGKPCTRPCCQPLYNRATGHHQDYFHKNVLWVRVKIPDKNHVFNSTCPPAPSGNHERQAPGGDKLFVWQNGWWHRVHVLRQASRGRVADRVRGQH